MKWTKTSESLPRDGEEVKFIHHGYEFDGKFAENHPHSSLSFLSETPPWRFTSVKDGGQLTTCEVSRWMPLPTSPEQNEPSQEK